MVTALTAGSGLLVLAVGMQVIVSMTRHCDACWAAGHRAARAVHP